MELFHVLLDVWKNKNSPDFAEEPNVDKPVASPLAQLLWVRVMQKTWDSSVWQPRLATIKSEHKKWSLQFHPDKNRDAPFANEWFQAAQKARQIVDDFLAAGDDVGLLCDLAQKGASESQVSASIESARREKHKSDESHYLKLTGLLDDVRQGPCSPASVFGCVRLLLAKLAPVLSPALMSRARAFIDDLSTSVCAEVKRALADPSPCEEYYRNLVEAACSRCRKILAHLMMAADGRTEDSEDVFGFLPSVVHNCPPGRCDVLWGISVRAFSTVSLFEWAPNDFMLVCKTTLDEFDRLLGLVDSATAAGLATKVPRFPYQLTPADKLALSFRPFCEEQVCKLLHVLSTGKPVLATIPLDSLALLDSKMLDASESDVFSPSKMLDASESDVFSPSKMLHASDASDVSSISSISHISSISLDSDEMATGPDTASFSKDFDSGADSIVFKKRKRRRSRPKRMFPPSVISLPVSPSRPLKQVDDSPVSPSRPLKSRQSPVSPSTPLKRVDDSPVSPSRPLKQVDDSKPSQQHSHSHSHSSAVNNSDASTAQPIHTSNSAASMNTKGTTPSSRKPKYLTAKPAISRLVLPKLAPAGTADVNSMQSPKPHSRPPSYIGHRLPVSLSQLASVRAVSHQKVEVCAQDAITAKYDVLIKTLWDAWKGICPQTKDWCFWLDMKQELVSNAELQANLRSNFASSTLPLLGSDKSSTPVSDKIAAKIEKFCHKYTVPVAIDPHTGLFTVPPEQDGNCVLLWATGADGRFYLSLQTGDLSVPSNAVREGDVFDLGPVRKRQRLNHVATATPKKQQASPGNEDEKPHATNSAPLQRVNTGDAKTPFKVLSRELAAVLDSETEGTAAPRILAHIKVFDAIKNMVKKASEPVQYQGCWLPFKDVLDRSRDLDYMWDRRTLKTLCEQFRETQHQALSDAVRQWSTQIMAPPSVLSSPSRRKVYASSALLCREDTSHGFMVAWFEKAGEGTSDDDSETDQKVKRADIPVVEPPQSQASNASEHKDVVESKKKRIRRRAKKRSVKMDETNDERDASVAVDNETDVYELVDSAVLNMTYFREAAEFLRKHPNVQYHRQDVYRKIVSEGGFFRITDMYVEKWRQAVQPVRGKAGKWLKYRGDPCVPAKKTSSAKSTLVMWQRSDKWFFMWRVVAP